MVHRKLFDRLRDSLKKFPTVGITGPRQVGKTALVKELAEDDRDCVHLDLERPNDRAKLADPCLLSLVP